MTAFASNLVGPIAGFVTALILGGFLTFYLLEDGDRAWAWLVAPIHGWRAEAITDSGRVALDRVGGYLRGTAIIATTDALTDFVYLTLLGVPLAAPLSVLVLLGGFVPYLGGFVATTVLALVTLATNGPTDVLILLVLIGMTNLVQTNVLAPMIYGKSLDVHPALVLIALPAGAALFGVMGLFAALPVVAFSRAIAPSVILALDRGPEDEPDEGALVPIWLDRLGQASWRGLVAFGLVAVLVAAAAQAPLVIVPVTLAIILAATLDPVAAALRRRGRSRGVSAAMVTAGTTLVVIGIVVLTLMTLIGPLGEILATAEDGADEGILGSIGLDSLVGVFSASVLQEVAGIVAGIAQIGVALLLATLLTFYFLRDGPSAWRHIVGRLAERRRIEVADAGSRAATVLGGYMLGTAAISLFGAATTAILMLILGLPLALPIAILAFVLGFIPYIGGFVSTVLAFLVTVSVGEPSDIVVMAIFTIVFNIAQGNFVQPLVYGRAVSLHPAVVLLAIPAGNQLAGIAGMFLIVPLLGIVAATWRSALRVVDTDEALAQIPPPDVVPAAALGGGALPTAELTPAHRPDLRYGVSMMRLTIRRRPRRRRAVPECRRLPVPGLLRAGSDARPGAGTPVAIARDPATPLTTGFRTLPDVPIAVIEFTFDPLIHLFDGFVVRWSTIALAAAIACTLVVIGLIGRRDRLRSDDLLFIVVGAVPGAVIGGRLGDVLRRPAAYQASPGGLIDPTFGGMDLALAVVGGIVTAAIVANLLRAPVGAWARACALPLLVLLGAGKLTMVLSGTGQGLPFEDAWATAYLGPGPWGSLAPTLPSYPSQAMEGTGQPGHRHHPARHRLAARPARRWPPAAARRGPLVARAGRRVDDVARSVRRWGRGTPAA